MSKPYRYSEAKKLLATIMSDFRILAGDEMGDANVSWQDVAGTAIANLRCLADRLQAAREGRTVEGMVVFPSPEDCEEGTVH